MEDFIKSLETTMGTSLPGIVGALLILIVGWIVATLFKAALKMFFTKIQLNNIVKKSAPDNNLDLVNGLASGGYFLILMITLVAVLNQLNLDVASSLFHSFTSQILQYLPSVLGGCVLILVAWLCATFLKQILSAGLKSAGIDKKIPSETPLSDTIGQVVYWFTLLLFVPGVLGVFQLEGLLVPTQNMVNKILGTIPNFLACGLIITIGWFVAKILREVTTNLLSAGGADKIGEKLGFTGQLKLSAVLGLVVYFFTLIPVIIAGLDSVQLYAISKPATEMLTSIFMAIPNIVAAIGIVLVTYFVARPVSAFVNKFLNAAGFNRLPEKLGFGGFKGSASQILANIIMFFMLLFAVVEAAEFLRFQKVSEILATLIQFGGQVVLGSVIIIAGLWIANVASASVSQTSKEGSSPLAGLVKTLVLILAVAMGLRAMGLANDIVNMAFGLTLGAVAVAFAISFGFGGQAAASKQIDLWMKKWNEK